MNVVLRRWRRQSKTLQMYTTNPHALSQRCRDSHASPRIWVDVVCLSGLAWGWNELETYVLHIFRIVCTVFNNTPSNADASHSFTDTRIHSTGTANPAWLHAKSFASLQFAKESHRVWMCDRIFFVSHSPPVHFKLKFVISLFICVRVRRFYMCVILLIDYLNI